MVDLPRGTVTFLFTDIEGSTELLRRLGGRYAGVLEDHLRLLRAATVDHAGREIDTQGDAFFAAFARASDAVGTAIDAQRALGAHAWPDGASVRVRMSVHTGEPAVGEERFVGLGVHRAARICAAGHGGQVLVSDATHRVLDDDPPEGVSFKDLGRCRLKDFAQPQHIFQLLAPGLRRDFPHVRTAAPARWRQVAFAAVALVGLAAVAVAIVAVAGGGSESAGTVTVKADAVGVIDPASRQLEEQIEVGPSPSDVLSTPGAVWVSNADGRSVSRIDPATHQVRQTITVGSSPAGLAMAGGSIWVANTLDGTVSRIDPATDSEVQKTTVGNDPTAVVAAGGAVWVANSGEQTLSRIDPGSGKATVKKPVRATPTDLIAADGSLWMSSEQSGTVSRLDPRTGRVEDAISSGGSPSALTATSGSVWAANPLDGTVTRIDPDRGIVTATILVGNGPDAIAAASEAVWVSDQYAGTVDRIDPRKNEVVRRIAVGNHPTGVALVNGALWVGVRASGAAHRGGTLTVAAGHGLIFIDPAVAYEPLSIAMLGMTNDGLLAYQHVSGAAGTRLVPDLALALPHAIEGGRAYRFVLRPGISYSNGAPVRLEDVRASFERVFKMAPDGVSYLFTGLVGAAACARAPRTCDLSKGITTDRRASAVTFHLTAPDPDFRNTVASSYADILPAGTPARAARAPLPATGPYEIARFRSGHVLRLVRNPRFREWSRAAQPDGYPDAIVFRSDLTLGAATAAVERGAADDFGGTDNIPPTRLEELTTRYPGRTHKEPTTGLEFLFMNTRVPPFDDVHVRRALNYALDRRALVRSLGGSAIGNPTCQVLAPNFPGYERYCPYQPPQLRRAHRLVEESGTRGSSVTVGAPDANHLPVARFAASVLRTLGYHASAKPLKHFFPMVNDSRSRAQIGALFVKPDYPAASNVFTPLLSCKAYVPHSRTNVNWAEFCDPRIDALMRRASAAQATDPEIANKTWALVDHRIVDAAPWVPVVNPASVEVVSERVGNYQYNPQYGSLLDQLWVR